MKKTIQINPQDNVAVATYASRVINLANEQSGQEGDFLYYTEGASKNIYAYVGSETDIVIPNGMTNIVEYAFYKRGDLTSVTIPSSIKSIDGYAFLDCSSLTDVTMKRHTPCSAYSNILANCSSLQVIHVPYGSVEAYKSAEGWSDYVDYIVEMEQKEVDDIVVEPTDISTMDYTLYFPSTEVNTGTTSTLSLNLKNVAEDITAFQCDIYLPEGVEWASTIDNRGNKVLTQPTFNTETERTDETYHTIKPYG